LKETYIETLIEAPAELHEVLIALLSEENYESFEEEESSLKAFIREEDFSPKKSAQALEVLQGKIGTITHRSLPQINWNKEWEANYESVQVDDFCQIVPTFHEVREGFVYTLRLDPKMAFGTGHHQTTRLMVRQMRRLSLEDKALLDMGCGTGILAILSRKMGANPVWAIDIDPWSEENCRENSSLNQVSGIEIALGDAKAIPDLTFDCILANINLNVLLADIPVYTRHLKLGGILIISGFCLPDIPQIEEAYLGAGLSLQHQQNENEWVSLALVKQKS